MKKLIAFIRNMIYKKYDPLFITLINYIVYSLNNRFNLLNKGFTTIFLILICVHIFFIIYILLKENKFLKRKNKLCLIIALIMNIILFFLFYTI